MSTKKNAAKTAVAAEPCQSVSIQTLKDSVEFMDCLSQTGFTRVGTIARLALLAMETPEGARDLDSIADALQAIWEAASDMKDSINAEAESVGCNHVDEPKHRRRASRAKAGAA